MTNPSDFDLLDAYLNRRSEPAFRELVSRHVDALYSAALRQLRNAHQAEEATQSAFIALALKASQLNRQTVIAGWLHHAVGYAARNLVRGESRRKRWEETAATMNPSHAGSDPESKEQLFAQIDDALGELAETDRDSIVLRFLEQRSLREVGVALGTSEEAAKKRVSRALDRLRDVLVRRGVTVTTVALSALLGELPITAAPSALSATVVSLALNGEFAATASSPADAPPPTEASPWGSTQLKAGVLAILAATGISLWLFSGNRPPSTPMTLAPSTMNSTTLRIELVAITVNDQEKALRFYTDVLGFQKKIEMPVGAFRYLTVVAPDEPSGPELSLEPAGFESARVYQRELFGAGIPTIAFAVGDMAAQQARLTQLGVRFTSEPVDHGAVIQAVLDDTCGNLIQLFQPKVAERSAASGPDSLKIRLSSVMVADQERALTFYTEVLGFQKKQDFPIGAHRWLTVVSPADVEGPQLLLEPTAFAPAKAYQAALHKEEIPLTAFAVSDIDATYAKLSQRGVVFQGKPTRMDIMRVAMFEDTCGNWIQLFEKK